MITEIPEASLSDLLFDPNLIEKFFELCDIC